MTTTRPLRLAGCALAMFVLVTSQTACRSRGDGNVLRPGGRPERATVDPASHCLPDDDSRNVTIRDVLDRFASAYNARNESALREVFRPVDIFDPMAVLLLGAAQTDRQAWLDASFGNNDTWRYLNMCVEAGTPPGAEVRVERANDLLRRAGVDQVDIAYKIQVDGGSIVRLVGDRIAARDDGSTFCASFLDQFANRGLRMMAQC